MQNARTEADIRKTWGVLGVLWHRFWRRRRYLREARADGFCDALLVDHFLVASDIGIEEEIALSWKS